jgi:predicted outer membrane repeat protein
VRGAGGAIFYECDENTRDCLFDMAQTTFTSNYAEIKGGAIHWDNLEPIFGGLTSPSNTKSNQFRSNKAGRYGDNISTFPSTVAIIKENDYK